VKRRETQDYLKHSTHREEKEYLEIVHNVAHVEKRRGTETMDSQNNVERRRGIKNTSISSHVELGRWKSKNNPEYVEIRRHNPNRSRNIKREGLKMVSLKAYIGRRRTKDYLQHRT
jgi:hypothetical protein